MRSSRFAAVFVLWLLFLLRQSLRGFASITIISEDAAGVPWVLTQSGRNNVRGMVLPKFVLHCCCRLVMVFLVLGSTVLNPSIAIATQVVPLSLNETVRRADAIVLGKVTA